MFPTFRIGVIQVEMFTVMSLLALYSCGLYYVCSGRFERMFRRDMAVCFVWGFVGAVLIGKAFAITLCRIRTGDWILGIRQSGFTYYGGMMGGFAGVLAYSRIGLRTSVEYLDVICRLLPLGQAIGRIGCYCNGCCYGKAYDGIGSVWYCNYLGECGRVYPTWFLESALCLMLFLLFQRWNRSDRGFHLGVYLIVYSILRWILEWLRGDILRGIWFGLSTSQWIGIPALLLGIGVMVRAGREPKRNYLFYMEM